MDVHVEEAFYTECMEEEGIMLTTCSSESVYCETVHGDVRRFMLDALGEHGQKILILLIDDKYKTVVLALFEDIHEQAKTFL